MRIYNAIWPPIAVAVIAGITLWLLIPTELDFGQTIFVYLVGPLLMGG